MNIEIVEFYPYAKKGRKIAGTLHVYLIDENIDLRGIHVEKKKDTWWFQIPYRTQYAHDTKKEERFPVFLFNDIEKNKDLMHTMRTEGIKYIEEKFLKNMQVENK